MIPSHDDDDNSIEDVAIDGVLEVPAESLQGDGETPLRNVPLPAGKRVFARGGRKTTFLSGVFRFLLKPGGAARSPVPAILRLLAMFIPTFIVMYLMYLGAVRFTPGRDAAAGSSAVAAAGDGFELTIGSSRVPLPLPEGFTALPLDEYYAKTPLGRAAESWEQTRIILAARRVNDADSPAFINVSVNPNLELLNFAPQAFQDVKRQYYLEKELTGSMQQGPNQIITPFAETENSICFGRRMGADGHTLLQYTCLLMTNGKAVFITSGVSGKWMDGEDQAEARRILLAWRDMLLPNG
ncbi:MAG: hypothetical protein LBJ46_10260 [Planctomycetota bacterium]|jgi:hypothetical protein|nr:hypothetical protein [Planctomycetota bacterium]